MNQLVKIWTSMSPAQRISLVVVPMILGALILGLTKWRHENDFRPLYTSLTPEDAAVVTQKIREAGIEYRLDATGSTVLVPSATVAESRLALAGAGLPRSGRIGFELFDRTSLGSSDFTEQVNYRRALEGELERTVATLSEIDQARVHITFAKESVFLDSRQPAKATVVVKMKRMGILPQANVVAIANLLASAVDGLAPEAVSVIDSSGRLLNRPRLQSADGDPNGAAAADANLEYRRQLESELTTKINTAIEPLLGTGHFHAGVNVDCDFTSSEQSDEVYDPSKSALLQTQSMEESNLSGGANSSAAAGGPPGTSANLPHPPAKEAPAGGATGLTRRTENSSYQPGKTLRHTSTPKGSIRKISTAVLVDETVRWEGSGAKARKMLIPASAETLKGIRDLVAGITGFSEQRGDQITIESLPFESTLSSERPLTAPAPVAAKGFDPKQPLVLFGVPVVVLLILAIVFLLVRRPAPKRMVADASADAAPAAFAVAAPQPAVEAAAANIRPDRHLDEQALQQGRIEAEALGQIKAGENSRKSEVLVRNIRESIAGDPAAAVNALRAWVSEPEGKRT